MRRTLATMAVIAALAAAFVLPAAIPAGAQNLSTCSDVISGSGAYSQSDQTVLFRVDLNAKSCPSVRYSLYILDEQPSGTNPSPAVVGHASVKGNHQTSLFYTIPVNDADDTICVYGTTTQGRNLFDRAPDASCVVLTDPPGAGGQRFD
jgi:hypothetical protein